MNESAQDTLWFVGKLIYVLLFVIGVVACALFVALLLFVTVSDAEIDTYPPMPELAHGVSDV